MTGYPSGQDGPFLPARDGPRVSPNLNVVVVFVAAVALLPYNTSFTEQACLAKMEDIGLVLFCVFMDLEFISVHKHTHKNWPISRHHDITLGH